jgi:hypothetical protein
VCYIREDSAVPERVDPTTGAVSTILKPCHKFRISFDARGPRDDIKVGQLHGGCMGGGVKEGRTSTFLVVLPQSAQVSMYLLRSDLLTPLTDRQA